MANHRPKSLSELNNVYDKAMRAEKAIKEGSSLLSTPETQTAPESENIFRQLETKAAEAQKSQVFDPDITDIANDFLKRYSQPEKPKAPPQEIKRPAPSIQSIYHSPAKEKQTEKQDIPLNTGSSFASTVKPQSAPVYKPAPAMPATDIVKPEATVPEAKEPQAPVALQTPVANAAEPAVPEEVKAPEVKEPLAQQTSARAEVRPAVDHTPRPAPSRVRITSTERSELMEEYMRVMSDEDDEPSYKKPKFSFFKKKKKYDEVEETETASELYENTSDEDGYNDEEIPVVPFDSSAVKYTDEYSDSPAQEEEQIDTAPMNLYDYIEADFDYDETDEDGLLDMSFGEKSEISDEISPEDTSEEAVLPELPEEEEVQTPEAYEEYPAEDMQEYVSEETETENTSVSPEETTEDIYPEVYEEDNIPEDTEDIVYPVEENEEAEDTVTPEEVDVYPDAPPAGMVFEDIFSVSDESKRSHTGGNWNEVFGEQVSEEAPLQEQEVPAQAQEAPEPEYDSYAGYEEDESDEAEYKAEESVEENSEDEDDYDDYKPSMGKAVVKALMVFAIILSFIGAGIATFLSVTIGVDSGKLFSEKYRAFSVPENLATVGLAKGDLVITENIYAQTNQLYVYVNQNDSSYNFGKVTATTTNLVGDYLYITQTEDGIQLINRDTSMGVVASTYSGIGTVLSVLCDYGIFIAVALIIFAAALIICLIILIRRQRRYNEAAAIYDNPDNFDNDGDDDGSDSSDGNNDDGEYYSDYDTDGIEQGLFVSI